MSRTKIPPKTIVKLWMRAGGRCEFRGCNLPLWRDSLTNRDINHGHVAHIIADSPNGVRGDQHLSPELAEDFDNLILLCQKHHSLVDDKNKEDEYPVELLKEYKQEHEERIERLTSINGEMQTHLVFFVDYIGNRKPSISYEEVRNVVLPRYPAESSAIELDLTYSPYRDHEPNYFLNKQDEISRMVDTRICQRSGQSNLKHISIFALASMPLLIHFGAELGETIPSDVYHNNRSDNSWRWKPQSNDSFEYIIEKPVLSNAHQVKAVSLNLSLSGTIHTDEIIKAIESPTCIYKMTIAEPSRNYLKAKSQLDLFKAEMRSLLRQIRETHGSDCKIHLFPAIPASIAVSLGQLLLPKSDPPIHVYENNQRYGDGFRYALTIPRNRYQ